MKKIFAACSLAFAFVLPAHASQLDDLLAKHLQDKAVPAMAALRIKDGKVVEQVVRGVRANDSPEKATLSDRWHIGSNAKALTATMMARLVERGVLSWDKTMQQYFPEMQMQAQYRDLTLVDLLSHRAGMPPNIDEKWIEATRDDKRPMFEVRQEFALKGLNEPPIGTARGEMFYSNTGYVIASAIAEKVTGKSFEVLMQEEVFLPLGIKTTFDPAKRGEVIGHENGKPVVGAAVENPPAMGAAGEVRLTMQEWAKFSIDQMLGERGKGKLLKAETYRFLHAQQGTSKSALGWGIKDDFPKDAPVRMISHAGSDGHWYAIIGLAPDSLEGLLIAANAAEGTEAALKESMIFKEIAAQFGKKK
ncbi:MAG: beta-lactamase family protein [Burkholderiales bacterium]|nr:beta-lactamase family protein [Burkholderiales bacterium]